MDEEILQKLFIIKFVLNLLYPDHYWLEVFAFLVIKYKVWLRKRNKNLPAIDTFEVRTIPSNIAKQLGKDGFKDNYPVILHKCIIISREQFMLLASENRCYENGVLWVVMKLTQDEKKRQKYKRFNDAETKHNLNFMTPELYKELWTNKTTSSIDNMRIVPIVGSLDGILENIAYTNENEYSNILSCFHLDMVKDVTVSFNASPNLAYYPKIASLAELCLIVNEYDLEYDVIKKVVFNHFKIPRLVCINDIFSIDLTPEIIPKMPKYIYKCEFTAKLHFRCENVEYENDNNEDNLVSVFLIMKSVTQFMFREIKHSVKRKECLQKLQHNENSFHTFMSY